MKKMEGECAAVNDERVAVNDESVAVKDETVIIESKNGSDATNATVGSYGQASGSQLPVCKERDKILCDLCGNGYVKTGIARHRKTKEIKHTRTAGVCIQAHTWLEIAMFLSMLLIENTNLMQLLMCFSDNHPTTSSRACKH